MDTAMDRLTEGFAHLGCADPSATNDLDKQACLSRQLRRMIDRGGGEVLVALVGEASPPRGTYEVLHVPWELHTACCEQIEAAATTLGACAVSYTHLRAHET